MPRRSGSSRKPSTPAERKAFSAKISTLAREGYTSPKQRAAIAYSELRRGGLARLRRNSGKKQPYAGTTAKRRRSGRA